jgi:hypothetical protein
MIEVKLRVGPFRLHVDLWLTAHAEPNELATPAIR